MAEPEATGGAVMTKTRLELLCHATEYIEDANDDFKTVLGTCLDEINNYGKTDLENKKERLAAAENALRAGLRFLEMFKKSEV
jgi:hypothetical protein